jgi:hypothetical protein
MMWDFRNLIHRAGGVWPRDWRDTSRKPIRPPSNEKAEGKSQASNDPGKRPDERWLTPPWQPPPGSGDAWKKPK